MPNLAMFGACSLQEQVQAKRVEPELATQVLEVSVQAKAHELVALHMN